MSIKLTDTQLVILSAAAQHDDRCLVAPTNLKGGAAQKVAAKLITAGLVKEIKAKTGMAIWRRDDAAGQAYALKLTPAGLKAIAVEEVGAPDGMTETPKVSVGAEAPSAAPSASAPREGTKLAQVIDLLRRDHGAPLDEIVVATGWLPHTARAALTGLRKRGYDVQLDRTNKNGSVYRLAAPQAHASLT